MIFVTVGTHEQPFDRLVRCIDELKGSGAIDEEVIVQTGFTDYEPKHCKWQKLYPFAEMQRLVSEARIVITHGGPSSFIMPLQEGKTPIVVPRQKAFDEHVNDHQVDFCRAVSERQGNIILVEETDRLADVIRRYDELVAEMPSGMMSNNRRFNEMLEQIVRDLFE